jgi:Na+/H+ antiporter NhaD/arsenite permease-like protein
MLTPVGNPQNLYLYSFYNLSILDFLKITFPYTALSLAFLMISLYFIKNEPLHFTMPEAEKEVTDRSGMIFLYLLLFFVCLTCVVRLLGYKLMLLFVLAAISIFDRKIIKKVDYALLMTFVFFFIFVGNMGSIPAVKNFLAELLAGKELGVSIAASQLISNVPAAVLLSVFTDQYKALILGTDIGGLGTLVASLASLISYKFYCRTEDAKPGKYLFVFTLYNLLFLIGLSLFYITSRMSLTSFINFTGK